MTRAVGQRSRFGRLLTAGAVGYLAGTIPSADLVSRAASGGSVDLRTSGTGNPGAANAMAVLGSRWGTVIMVADIVKAAAASRLGQRLAGPDGAHLAGTAAVVGHCFPVWTGFRGGKGVACSVGQCLATFPAYLPFDLGVAALTASGPWRSRARSATVAASVAWVGAGVVWWRRRLPNAWGPPATGALPLGAAASSGVILYRFFPRKARP
ncbi:MAG TPA: glycerol-3-phosphate acyltransferase [Acidimicrobiales bacterium]|nr:glycerol-3-phosphate acyltransferase [Acidimicrobiales bacterium]